MPDLVGRYRLIEPIAAGGMGEIYRGVETGGSVERPVAIKLIKRELSADESFRRQFIDEAELSFVVCHSNVVQVRDFGEADGQYYMVLEWVEGSDVARLLDRLLRRGGRAFPVPFALHVARDAALGLDYAHRLRDKEGTPLKLIHRDVSAANILVSLEGEVKLTDFGVARSRLRVGESLPGVVKGKIAYMAPEHARATAIDQRVDVFSLGVVLYEMVTGVSPFPQGGDQILRVSRCLFDPPRKLDPSLPEALEAIVLKAMAREPEQRYPSAAAMCRDLEQLARELGCALSAADLGEFVRGLLAAGPATLGRSSLTGQTTAAIAPVALGSIELRFDDALKAELDGGSTEPGRPVRAPPPASGPQGIALQPTAAAELDDLPASPARASVGKWLLGTALVAAGAFTIAWAVRRTEPPPAAPPVAAAPPPARAAPAPPIAVPTPVVVAAAPGPAADKQSASGPRHPPPRAKPPHAPIAEAEPPAHLSVQSDVAARVFVDDRPLGVTPIDGAEVQAGAHLVRVVDENRSSLRYLPHEQRLTLRPGESRRLQVSLAGPPR